MLVDNPLPHQFTDLSDIFHTDLLSSPATSSSSASSSTVQSAAATSNSNSNTNTNSPPSSSSRASSPSSPYNGLLTPPQESLPTSFPEIQDSSQEDSFMSLFEEELQAASKASSSSSSYDFMNMGFNSLTGDVGMNMPMGMNMMPMDGMLGLDSMMGVMGGMDINSMSMPLNMNMSMSMPMGMNGMGVDMSMLQGIIPSEPVMGIDPQLVDSPTSTSPSESMEEEKKDEEREEEKEEEREKLTLTIAPVKVGGYGKNRRGTVQSGGVTKKVASPPLLRDASSSAIVAPAKLPTPPPAPAPTKSPKTNKKSSSATTTTAAPSVSVAATASTAGTPAPDDDDEDDHDLPKDWRPPPEVFAKMTSKEKRQLRNKISARNFRVRRKEYISTLEGDIAERDRLLDAIRTELGSTKDENRALRQEIEALKKTLLDGRGAGVNLPPPAPLSSSLPSASTSPAATSSTASNGGTNNIIAPNTLKDLPTSPRLRGTGSAFWGGAIGGMGITPVHATFVPEVALGRKENINPSLNINPALNAPSSNSNTNMTQTSVTNAVSKLGGFDGFADVNPFTMKTLDAYRMHLWGKMAQQQANHHHHQQQQQNHHHNSFNAMPTGLASSLKPLYFSSSSSTSKPPPSMYGTTLSALLSGKHSSSSSIYPSPPTSPKMGSKIPSSVLSGKEREKDMQREREQQQQQAAIIAAMASQTLLKKLGSAFWDAFSGSGSGQSIVNASVAPSAFAPSSSSSAQKNWDPEKVRKVLEGKAVVRVVDVEPPTQAVQPVVASSSSSTVPVMRTGGAGPGAGGEKDKTTKCHSLVCDILEESMRSLTLGKKM